MEFAVLLLVIFHRVIDTHGEIIHVQFLEVFLGRAPVECLEGHFLQDLLLGPAFLRMLREH